uniref:START domain-containing protein n=1 Tax=Panagrolaimus sp. JU765 TaxID=591449 RepID=A0AC34Q4T1_9BILA
MSSTIEFNGIVDVLKPEHSKYEKPFEQIGEGFKLALEIFNDDDFKKKNGWKIDSESHGMTVYSKNYPFGKVFALTAQLAAPMETVFDVTIRDFGNTAKWSANVTKSEIVVKLTDNVDIVYYANPDVMIVKSRDYVTGRIWRKIDNQYYVAVRSVDVDDLKETKEHVRGKLHLGCGRMTPINGHLTQVEYLLCIDFKGLIPKTVVNAVMGRIIMKDLEETDKHLKEVCNNL